MINKSNCIIHTKEIANYSLITMYIKSFSKIQVSPYLLKDIYRYIHLSNINYLLLSLKKMRSIILSIVDRYTNIINNSETDFTYKYKLLNIIKRIIGLKNNYVLLIRKLEYIADSIKIVRFPMRLEHIGILKSPHVFKKAQDHYEIRKYQVMITFPLILSNEGYHKTLDGLIEQTTRINPLYQITFKRRYISILSRNMIN